MRHVHNPLADNVRERSAVDEDPSKLVDTSMACNARKRISHFCFRAHNNMASKRLLGTSDESWLGPKSPDLAEMFPSRDIVSESCNREISLSAGLPLYLCGWRLSDMIGVISLVDTLVLSLVDSSRSSKGSSQPHNVTLDSRHNLIWNAAKMPKKVLCFVFFPTSTL